MKAIQFAKQVTETSNIYEDISINLIMHARKTLLFSEGILWVKKEGNENFDVPMGCFDDAEVCELVGSYIFQVFQHHSADLYRDDGLAILKDLSGPETERVKVGHKTI